MPIKTKLYAHQQETVDKIKDLPYYALFFECGTGKTITSLAIMDYRKTKHKNYRTLVICPNTIVENWADEVVKHSDLTAVTLQGAKAKRLKTLEQEADIYIINYESVRILKHALFKKGFDFLVLDESTCVKNPKSLQSRSCYELATYVKDRLLLTGTPIMNNPLDIFGQYRILDVSIYGANYYRFRARYAILGGYLDKQVVRWVNMIDFRERLYRCAVKKTKDECLDLPEKLHQIIRLDLPDEQRRVYDDLKTHFISQYRDGVITAAVMLTRLMRFSQITAGFTKNVEGEEHAFQKNPKVKWLVDFVHDLHVERKVVVFCRFTYEIDMVERALHDANYKFVTVRGGVKDRIALVRQFNQDKTTRVFIGQLQTTGMGINLTAGNYAVFMSNVFSYGQRVQACDRIHRIGQSRNCTYIDLLMKNTIDVHIHNTLKRKESLSSMATEELVKMI